MGILPMTFRDVRIMAKLTLGQKGQRFKESLYALGILLLIIVGSCHVCRRIDWSAVQRRQLEKNLLELESQILLAHQPPEKQMQRLIGQCSVWLRDRWLMGYLYSETTKKGYFIGRISSPEFRWAVEGQASLIEARKPLDKKKIPKLRLDVEFRFLKCRLLVAEPQTREETLPGAPARK